jgi:hypothetical protein
MAGVILGIILTVILMRTKIFKGARISWWENDEDKKKHQY